MNDVQARKAAASEFLRWVVAGKIAEAYEKHVDMGGIHHNPYFPAGFEALRNAMMENHLEFPGKRLTVRNVIGDGDLVAVHSHLVMRAGEPGMAVVHIFRFEGRRIVEMWDCGQILPSDSLNKDGAF